MRSIICALVLIAAGCGSPAAHVLSGNVSGQFQGAPFTALFGFAKDRPGKSSLIGLGAGALNCGTPDASDPPPGINGLITVSALDVGSYSNVGVLVLRNEGAYEAHGSNGGVLDIAASNPASVTGTIAFTYSDSGGNYSLNGTFEVARCN